MIQNRFRTVCALILTLVALDARAVETLHWKRLPLAVDLHVGEERVIFTEREMRVGIPGNLKEGLRVQSANGAIYLRALVPLHRVRVQLHDAGSAELVMLDVTATDGQGDPPLEPLRIEMTDSAKKTETKKEKAPTTLVARQAVPAPILLTRTAAQNLYAPLRAIEHVEGIRRVTVRTDLDLSTLMPTLPIACRVLAAWKLDESTVTAVLLRNTSRNTLQLDPRQLQGDFVAATFQHPYLGPRGEATDTTVLYLVTQRRSLAESLLPASLQSAPGGSSDEK